LEDHRGIRSALELLLEWEGHTVVGFERGEYAIDYLQRYSADFVLMDWNTPGVCGAEFLKLMEQACLPLFRPLVGVLSGDAAAQQAVDDYGAKFFFMKPFEPEVLVRGLLTAV